MNTFKFDEKKVEQLKLNINGVKFEFNPHTLEVQEAVRDFVNRQKPILAKFQDKNITEQELNEQSYKTCVLVKETVNKILGKRSYERIFKDRSANYEEHMKLVEFMFNAMEEFASEHPNRQITH